MVLASDVAKFVTNINGPSGEYNLTDGYHPSFYELENDIANKINKRRPPSIPYPAAKILGWAGDLIGSSFPLNTNRLKKITNTLTFDDGKARSVINWQSNHVLKYWQES